MKKERRKIFITVILVCVFVLFSILIPLFGVFLTGILLPARYDETYYGELAQMYSKLKNTQGKKIVVIGNSNVAFGLDSALAENLLQDAGMDYSVCSFGLYGALGTRLMCELAFDFIGEEDIVIFTPELLAQSLSLYFSVEETWYALDGDMEMFSHLSGELREKLIGGYTEYASKKLSLYRSGKKAEPSGIYARSSFDENCDLKNYDRSHNVIAGGANSQTHILLNVDIFSTDFVDYVNNYAQKITKKGAQILYSFAPMNGYSIPEEEKNKSDEFYLAVCGLFDFPVISHPDDYVMDGEWFYDFDFHLNDSGMTVRTVQLVDDIKNETGNTVKTNCVLPEKPIMPDSPVEEDGEGDNTDADMFLYNREGNYYTIVALSEEGKNAEEPVIPYRVNGLYVKSFTREVFSGNKNIRKITVQENIQSLSDGSFSGCSALEEIILKHTDPADISVGYGLLNGTQKCKILVPSDALSKFQNNYFWGKYAKELQGY